MSLRQLHAASLPFITRALRGGRRIRYAAGAVLLAALTVLLGFWIALGPGRLEHELRSSLNLERPMYMQEMIEGKIWVEDEAEAARLNRQIDELRRPDLLARVAGPHRGHDSLHAEWRVVSALENQLEAVLFAATSPVDRGNAHLQQRARELQQRLGLPDVSYQSSEWSYLNWHDPDDVDRVRHALDSELRPVAIVYGSPLAAADAIRLTGMIAGGLLFMLLALLAPVLAGTQMAQEVHENTLQPLTGTALGARQLVLGMTAGPLAVVGLVAAPQVVLLLGAAAATGTLPTALAMLVVVTVGGLFLTMLAQLAGLALGRQRTPGLIGVALLGALVPLAMLGAALAIELPARAVGLLALLPQAAAAWLLCGAFVPPNPDSYYAVFGGPDHASSQLAVTVGTVGMLCFAWLGLRALERRIGDLAPTALTRVEALFGAFISVVLVGLANPYTHHHYDAAGFYLLNLALAAVPFAILLMMRVPQGDVPLALRRVPVGALVGEFTAMVGLHFVVCAAVMGPELLEILGAPIAVLYLLWSVVVAALLAVRVAALPHNLVGKLWLGVCGVGLIAAFIHAVWWADHRHGDLDDIFALWQVSPLLGLAQIVLLFAIPATLLRALRSPATAAPTEA